MEQIEVFYFYFDIIDVVKSYLAKQPVIENLLQWQRGVRSIPTGAKINCKTFADNVLARFEVDGEYPVDFNVLQYAGKTMQLARDAGFEKFFGVVTKGIHEFDIHDRTITSYGSVTDMSTQHLDTFSDPYLRAVLAEKWSGDLAAAKLHPGTNAVWVSEEVVQGGLSFGEAYYGQELEFRDLGITFDLHDSKYGALKRWPFKKSKFSLIA